MIYTRDTLWGEKAFMDWEKKLKIMIIIKLYKGKDGGMPVKRVSGPEVGQAEDTTSDIKTT